MLSESGSLLEDEMSMTPTHPGNHQGRVRECFRYHRQHQTSWRGFTEACAMELSVVDGNARHIPYTGTWCSLADDDVGGEETEG